MISKFFGLVNYLKKHHGDPKVHRTIYLRITADGVMKEMSIHRSWDHDTMESQSRPRRCFQVATASFDSIGNFCNKLNMRSR